MTLQHQLEKVESVVFSTLMESVLRFSQVLDVGVFLMVEDKQRRRRYGGSKDLCAAFEDHHIGIGLQNDDVFVELDGVEAALREVVPRASKRRRPTAVAADADAASRLGEGLPKKRPRVSVAYGDEGETESPFVMDAVAEGDNYGIEDVHADADAEAYLETEEEVGVDGAQELPVDDFAAEAKPPGPPFSYKEYDEDGLDEAADDEDFQYSNPSDSSDDDWRNSNKAKTKGRFKKKDLKLKGSRKKRPIGKGWSLVGRRPSASHAKGRSKRPNLAQTIRDSVQFSYEKDDDQAMKFSSPSLTPTSLVSAATKKRPPDDEPRRFKCQSCGSAFKRDHHLTRHSRNVHGIYEDEDADWK